MPRKAIITGGTRGIGRAIADRLSQDGFQVTVTATSAQRPPGLLDSYNYVGCDLSVAARISTLAETVRALLPDVLVNNAGINIKGTTPAFSLDDFDRLVNVNLRAPFALMQAALPRMIENGWGRIVNITSLWAETGNPLDAAYCATKHGLDGMTASVAAEVARSGVMVNAVAPGFIYTEAAREAYTPESLASVSGQIPVGRLGRPDEVASLISWLVSEENTYMTGQNVLIDGGLTRTAKP